MTSLCWHPSQRRLLATTADGGVILVSVPTSFPDTSHSFDLNLRFAQYKVMLQPPPRAVPVAVSGESAGAAASTEGEGKEGGTDNADSLSAPVPEAVQYITEEPRETGAALAAAFHPAQVAQPRLLSACCNVHLVMSAHVSKLRLYFSDAQLKRVADFDHSWW